MAFVFGCCAAQSGREVRVAGMESCDGCGPQWGLHGRGRSKRGDRAVLAGRFFYAC